MLLDCHKFSQEVLLYSITYVSSATHAFSQEQLFELLDECRGNNLRENLTGQLLYKNQEFMQVLEGEEEPLKFTFEKICCDKRHKNILILNEGSIDHREFCDWTMGFYNLDNEYEHHIPGYSDILNYPLTGNEFQSQPSLAQILLLSFKDTY
ncbi:BluF domain-containing protein [Methylophaga marina]|uniref:BLUF domain-containing protein n=1 Tax=Methylophaga marina TaxID=45495 RepID=A0ABP3DN46_9GAMM|nr:BLUF domain-containing protein [Methylophaga marina]BDZ74801.1 BluF domain-containing protein [Methylophaga marina]